MSNDHARLSDERVRGSLAEFEISLHQMGLLMMNRLQSGAWALLVFTVGAAVLGGLWAAVGAFLVVGALAFLRVAWVVRQSDRRLDNVLRALVLTTGSPRAASVTLLESFRKHLFPPSAGCALERIGNIVSVDAPRERMDVSYARWALLQWVTPERPLPPPCPAEEVAPEVALAVEALRRTPRPLDDWRLVAEGGKAGTDHGRFVLRLAWDPVGDYTLRAWAVLSEANSNQWVEIVDFPEPTIEVRAFLYAEKGSADSMPNVPDPEWASRLVLGRLTSLGLVEKYSDSARLEGYRLTAKGRATRPLPSASLPDSSPAQ